MNAECVRLQSGSETISGSLFLPETEDAAPALIICHGAGEFKENYFEFCEFLATRGIASLALDMRGHGQSEGTRFQVNIREWVADVRAAVNFLFDHPRIDGDAIGALGLSSGGTAILEAALEEPRLRFLVALDATVRNSMPLPVSLLIGGLVQLGKLKTRLTGEQLRLPLLSLFKLMHLASDPEIDHRIRSNPEASAAFRALPFPGVAQAFFVDTIRRVPEIKTPTLVLWGEDDQLDSPDTARELFSALTCPKELHIIPGNGHVGHLDRNRRKVFELTADWVLRNTPPKSAWRASAAS